jgi:hypothetical protein
MAAPTSTEFLQRFPEFANQASLVVEGAIQSAALFTPESVWGDLHNAAVGYLAAHQLASRVMQIGSQVGAEAGAPKGEQINSTLYGQEYERLRRSLPVFGLTV